MRINLFRKMFSKTFVGDSTALVIGLVVWPTQLHEKTHCRFPIADNGALRTLTCVALCRLKFWSDFNEIFSALTK